jgi:succinate dehydrogenase/fumarate reductase flavoprotein subunit
MDFRANASAEGLEAFDLRAMEPEARNYLLTAAATQPTPIARLRHMNPAAIDIYAENGIDLHTEPLEIAVCAQHCNGGLAVNRWWESTVPHAFVVGELAGTHGVKRPGGSALNAGQVGSLRAAEYIVCAYGADSAPPSGAQRAAREATTDLIDRLTQWATSDLRPADAIAAIQDRMTRHGGHIRQRPSARTALTEARALCEQIANKGLAWAAPRQLAEAIEAENIALTSAATLQAIVALLDAGAGSRGSHLVLAAEGQAIHPEFIDPATKTPLCALPEAPALRETIQQVTFDPTGTMDFTVRTIAPRSASLREIAFELAWQEYNAGEIFRT